MAEYRAQLTEQDLTKIREEVARLAARKFQTVPGDVKVAVLANGQTNIYLDTQRNWCNKVSIFVPYKPVKNDGTVKVEFFENSYKNARTPICTTVQKLNGGSWIDEIFPTTIALDIVTRAVCGVLKNNDTKADALARRNAQRAVRSAISAEVDALQEITNDSLSRVLPTQVENGPRSSVRVLPYDGNALPMDPPVQLTFTGRKSDLLVLLQAVRRGAA